MIDGVKVLSDVESRSELHLMRMKRGASIHHTGMIHNNRKKFLLLKTAIRRKSREGVDLCGT